MNRAQHILEMFHPQAITLDPMKTSASQVLYNKTLHLSSGRYDIIIRYDALTQDVHIVFEFEGDTSAQYVHNPLFMNRDRDEVAQATGDVSAIYQMISNMIHAILQRHDVKTISFSADANHKSKKKLYDRFASLIAHKLHGRVETREDEGFYKYYIIHIAG